MNNDYFLQPRALSYLQSIFIPSSDIEVEQTAYNTADTATVKSILSEATLDFGALTQQNTDPIPFKILLGSPTDPHTYSSNIFDQLFYGFLDEIDTVYEEDALEFRIRGPLALLIDTRTTQRVDMNVDIGAALTKLIQGVGLTPVVSNAGVNVGRVLNDDSVMMGRNIRVLEYMQTLAAGIGWIIRCQGQNVIVGPPPDRTKVPTITKTWSAGGALKLRITHSALHAHNIKVKVVSYIPKSKTTVTSAPVDTTDLLTGLGIPTSTTPSQARVHAPSGRQTGFASGNFAFTRSEEYVFHIPNLTKQQCDERAALIQKELSRHEFIAEMEFTPTATELRTIVQNSPEFLIQLRGATQASHNQLYHPRKVSWTYSLERGFVLNVLAVNHDVPVNTGGQ